jgi:hypothetical protein
LWSRLQSSLRPSPPRPFPNRVALLLLAYFWKLPLFAKRCFIAPCKITPLAGSSFAANKQREGHPKATNRSYNVLHDLVAVLAGGLKRLPSRPIRLFVSLVGSNGRATAIMTSASMEPVQRYGFHPKYIYIDTMSTSKSDAGIMPSQASRIN